MPTPHLRRAAPAALALATVAALSGAVTSATATSTQAGIHWTDVGAPNPKAPGVVAADALSPELAQIARVQGAVPLENPTAAVPYYGYDGDRPNMVPLPACTERRGAQDRTGQEHLPRASGTASGADPHYDYGTHFLFQGHESGTPGYITRINLDADQAHRVTLLATQDVAGANLPD